MKDSYSVGRALGLGFSIWLKNIIPFTILAVLISSPAIIYAYSTMAGWSTEYVGVTDIMNFERILNWIQSFVGLLLTSTLTFGVIRELKGQRASLASCIGVGLRRFLPVVGISILVGLIVFIPAFVTTLVLVPVFDDVGVIGAIVVAGAIQAIYYVAIPASVIERGVASAMLRSRELTSGHRVGIFATLALLIGGQYLVVYLLRDVIIARDATAGSFVAALRTYFWVDLGITMLSAVLTGTVAAVTYYLLRAEKEGTSADELAAVFE